MSLVRSKCSSSTALRFGSVLALDMALSFICHLDTGAYGWLFALGHISEISADIPELNYDKHIMFWKYFQHLETIDQKPQPPGIFHGFDGLCTPAFVKLFPQPVSIEGFFRHNTKREPWYPVLHLPGVFIFFTPAIFYGIAQAAYTPEEGKP